DQGRMDQARLFFEQALLNARKMGARSDEGAILADLALLYEQMGRPREAMTLKEQAFAIARDVGQM
ncbi:MAG TPA: tetratricopeptide repeat protein, partial [Polyangium sp.]|nr:tetratricopeptide repeat protein [Polyangium sp.]